MERVVFVVSATQQALADRVGVTRQSVNKQLRSWSSQGLIEVWRGKVRIRTPVISAGASADRGSFEKMIALCEVLHRSRDGVAPHLHE